MDQPKDRFAKPFSNGRIETVAGNAASVKDTDLRRYSSLAVIANNHEKSAAKGNEISARNLKRMQEQDDRLRVNSICSECGAKALYFQEGKKYCKAHIHIGQEIRRKKYTPQAPEKREKK